MFGRLLRWYTFFGGSCPLTKFYPVQNSHYVQLLRSPIYAALLHGTPAAGVSQTLPRGTRNGITELSQTAPPIFGWAATTLGIGPHSSCNYSLYYNLPNSLITCPNRSGAPLHALLFKLLNPVIIPMLRCRSSLAHSITERIKYMLLTFTKFSQPPNFHICITLYQFRVRFVNFWRRGRF